MRRGPSLVPRGRAPAFALLLILAGGCRRPEAPAPTDPVAPQLSAPGRPLPAAGTLRIASIFPDRGRYAASGIESERGVEMAEEALRASGTIHGRTIEFLRYRTGSFLADAAAAAVRAIEDGVLALVGPNSSDLATAVAERAEDGGVLMVSNVATAPELTRGRTFVFRVCYSDARLGELLARFACRTLGLQRVAALFEVSRLYSSGLAQAFLEAFRRECPGGEARAFHYLEFEVDFRAPLGALRDWGPEAVFAPGSSTDVSLIGAQMEALGIRVPLIGGDSWSRSALFERGGPPAVSYHSDHWRPGGAFLHAFRARYGSDPEGARAALSWDAAEGIRLALAAVGPLADEDLAPPGLRRTRSRLRDRFREVDFEGLTGRIRYGGSGDPEKGCHLFRVTRDPEEERVRSEWAGMLP